MIYRRFGCRWIVTFIVVFSNIEFLYNIWLVGVAKLIEDLVHSNILTCLNIIWIRYVLKATNAIVWPFCIHNPFVFRRNITIRGCLYLHVCVHITNTLLEDEGYFKALRIQEFWSTNLNRKTKFKKTLTLMFVNLYLLFC